MISDTTWQQTQLKALLESCYKTVLEAKLQRSSSDPVGRKKTGYLLLLFLWMRGQMNHKHRNTCKVHPERNLLIIGFYCFLIFFADRYFQLSSLSIQWQTPVTQQWYWCPSDKPYDIDHCLFTNAFARSETVFKTTVLPWKAIATCYSQAFSVLGAEFLFLLCCIFSLLMKF